MSMSIHLSTDTCEAYIPWQTPTNISHAIENSDKPLEDFVAYFKDLWCDGAMDEDIERVKAQLQAYLEAHPNAKWTAW